MTNCTEFLMTTVPLGLQGVVKAQSIVCKLGGINVQPTRRIYLKVPRGVLQLFLRWFLITEEISYQSATYTQEQEMTNTYWYHRYALSSLPVLGYLPYVNSNKPQIDYQYLIGYQT